MKLSLGMVLGATWRRPHLATSGQLELKLALLLPNAAHNAQEEAYIYIYYPSFTLDASSHWAASRPGGTARQAEMEETNISRVLVT